MEQLEIISWKILDAIRNSATKTFEVIGDIDTNEQLTDDPISVGLYPPVHITFCEN